MKRGFSRGVLLRVVLPHRAGEPTALREFLLAEDWRYVVGLLVVFAVALVAMQRMPAIERRIEAAFAAQKRASTIIAVLIVLAFPLVLEGNTYAFHLCVVAQLYAVLALALNFQLGSANIPNFATATWPRSTR